MLLDIVRFVMCICIRTCCLSIKAVEGSGSEGASKYVGEGVTYGVLLVNIFTCVRLLTRTCQVTDAWRQEAHTATYVIMT